MKDKIGDILDELYDNVQDGEYWDKTLNDLTALMCYREAKAYRRGCGEPLVQFEVQDCTNMLKENGYTQEMITKAIEQLKKDML